VNPLSQSLRDCQLPLWPRWGKRGSQELGRLCPLPHTVIPTKRKRVEGSPGKNVVAGGDFSLALAYRQRNFPPSARMRLSDKISEMTGGEERGGKRPKNAQKLLKQFAIFPILQFQRPILQVLLTFWEKVI